MQNNVYTTPGFFEDVSEVFRTVSSYPAKIIEFGQDQNEKITEFMQRLQGSAGGAAEQLRRTEVEAAGGRAAAWIDENKQIITGGVLIAIIIWMMK